MASMLRKLKEVSIFGSFRGRHIVSLWVSRIFERSGIKRFFGLNLVAAVIFTGVVTPETSNLLSVIQVEEKIHETPISGVTATETTFEMPLTNFAISQTYSFWHQGIDMTAAIGTPIYAIEDGIVEYTENSFFGYGKHVILAHEKDIKSLYAHLSEIATVVGRHVKRGEMIGRVGSTGWATGDHLHLEIYQNGLTLNPLELLPIKPKDIVYDPVFTQVFASASATPTAIEPISSPQSTLQSLPQEIHTLDQTPVTATAPGDQY